MKRICKAVPYPHFLAPTHAVTFPHSNLVPPKSRAPDTSRAAACEKKPFPLFPLSALLHLLVISSLFANQRVAKRLFFLSFSPRLVFTRSEAFLFSPFLFRARFPSKNTTKTALSNAATFFVQKAAPFPFACVAALTFSLSPACSLGHCSSLHPCFFLRLLRFPSTNAFSFGHCTFFRPLLRAIGVSPLRFFFALTFPLHFAFSSSFLAFSFLAFRFLTFSFPPPLVPSSLLPPFLPLPSLPLSSSLRPLSPFLCPAPPLCSPRGLDKRGKTSGYYCHPFC